MNNNQQPNPFPELEALRKRAEATGDKVERLRLMQQWVEKAGQITEEDTGRKKQLEEQRVREYGCATDGEALETLEELKADVEALQAEVDAGSDTLMGEMGWQANA